MRQLTAAPQSEQFHLTNQHYNKPNIHQPATQETLSIKKTVVCNESVFQTFQQIGEISKEDSLDEKKFTVGALLCSGENTTPTR